MAKKSDAKNDDKEDRGNVVAQQTEQQTGRRVRVRVDERDVSSAYANAFRTNATAEEVIIDFGLNSVNQSAEQQKEPEIIFDVAQRVIMNYYSAKRLAVTLSQLIRQHEDQFGELQLDVDSRRRNKGKD